MGVEGEGKKRTTRLNQVWDLNLENEMRGNSSKLEKKKERKRT